MLEGAKLSENLRSRSLTFRELFEDALAHSRAENSEKQTYELCLRIDQLLAVFGARPADSIRKNEIVSWLVEQAEDRDVAPTTRNRRQATFSLMFRVVMDNEEIERNPAARIRCKTEVNGRVSFPKLKNLGCVWPYCAASSSSCHTSCSRSIPGCEWESSTVRAGTR